MLSVFDLYAGSMLPGIPQVILKTRVYCAKVLSLSSFLFVSKELTWRLFKLTNTSLASEGISVQSLDQTVFRPVFLLSL